MSETNAVPVLEAVPEIPEEPKQIIVEENDRLRAELLATKHLNMTHQITIMQMQLNNLQRATQELLDQIGMQQGQLEGKYGINLQTHQIMASSGLVVPRPGTHPGSTGMLPR